MIRTGRTTVCYFTRAISLIGVVASLCFSVGEGLRLRPFPISSGAHDDFVVVPSIPKVSSESWFQQYGPIYAMRVQSRNKRQVVEYACPPFKSVCESILNCTYRFRGDGFHRVSSEYYRSSPSGRAPPLFS